MMAFHRLKGLGQPVVDDLVVSRRDKDFACDFDADLRRSGHMARRMERHARIPDLAGSCIAAPEEPVAAEAGELYGTLWLSAEWRF